jgi:hypothetical protein
MITQEIVIRSKLKKRGDSTVGFGAGFLNFIYFKVLSIHPQS